MRHADVGPPSLIAAEAGAHCFLKDGREPLYQSRRKFSYYLCAASTEIQATLLNLLRLGKEGE